MVMYALLLPVLIGMAALIVDVGHAFVVKRHLQKAADAAALAAAFELDGATGWETRATNVANLYSASPGGHNLNPDLPAVTTVVGFPAPTGAKVRVTEKAKSGVFFGGIFEFEGFNISATAVASRQSTTGASPLAVYVHELCGAPTGNKGLNVNGQNTLIQGGIHVNGQFKISNSGFRSEAETTVYRPPTAPSLPPPTQGSCDGSGSPKIENNSTARYCTVVCAPGNPMPTYGPWRDWVTPYHTADIVKTRVNSGTCTHTYTSDFELKASDFPGGVMVDARFICLPLDKKFTLTGALKGPSGAHARLTVVAGDIVVNTSAGAKIRPFNDAEPVLFSSWRTGGEVIINPAGSLDWIGYVINRKGGMTVNSGGVVSPREGLLEAEWIVVNGENFTMIGRGPPAVGGTGFGGVSLEE